MPVESHCDTKKVIHTAILLHYTFIRPPKRHFTPRYVPHHAEIAQNMFVRDQSCGIDLHLFFAVLFGV